VSPYGVGGVAVREGCDCPKKSVRAVPRAGAGTTLHSTADFLLLRRDLLKNWGRKPPGHVPRVATWLVFTVLSQPLRGLQH